MGGRCGQHARRVITIYKDALSAAQARTIQNTVVFMMDKRVIKTHIKKKDSKSEKR